jgi:DNA replication protein DnaC
MADLIEKLKADHGAGKTGRSRSHYKSSLVVVDEVGYMPVSREECHLFYRFVATRYEKASTIITSNKAFADWEELFHDPIIVTAILDRLLHHSVLVNIKGHSYRLRGKIAGQREEGAGGAASAPEASRDGSGAQEAVA